MSGVQFQVCSLYERPREAAFQLMFDPNNLLQMIMELKKAERKENRSKFWNHTMQYNGSHSEPAVNIFKFQDDI